MALSERELEKRVAYLERLHAQPGMPKYEWKLLDRKELAALVPGIGPGVVGASWTPMDGHVNPLKLLRALHRALEARGADYLPNRGVTEIARRDGLFELATASGPVRAKKIVLASGLGNAKLAPQVGLNAPVRPQRGQIIVLERTKPFLKVPISTLRQTDEGTVLIGDSQEETGYAEGVGLPILATLASRAVATFPALAEVRITRSWAALRVMSKDGFPVYEQSETHPGAFLATCHSGRHACRCTRVALRGRRRSPGSCRRSSRRSRRGGSMFRRLPDAAPASLLVTVDGKPLECREGDSVAAALLAAGYAACRTTAVIRDPARSLLHDGHLLRLPGRDRRPPEPAGLHDQGAPGMRIERQQGAREVRP